MRHLRRLLPADQPLLSADHHTREGTRYDHHAAQPAAVWIGCLECYNSGRLVGDWHPAVTAGDVTTDDVHGRAIPPGTHEELWCLDTDGLPVSREMSPAEAQEWAEHLEQADEWQRPALLAWIASGDYVAEGTGDLPSLPDFEERYAGEWASFQEYAESLADDIGLLSDAPETLAAYFDWEKWTRDLSFDYTTEPTPGGGVFIFRSL